MEGDESFVVLVHHHGKIKHKSREGVKFTDKSPSNIFLISRTTLSELQRIIIRKLGLDSRKRVRIYYRIPIFVVAQGVKYGCLAIEGDDDLQIVFHCRKQFPEVRTTELFVEVADSLASSGGSAPHPRPVNAATIGGTELGDYSRFGVPEPDGAILPPVSLPAFEGVPEPDPQVEEALRADDFDVEPEFIEEDSDNETGPAPPPQRDTSSSGTQQYPRHLSNLNLEALSGPGRGAMWF
ncbi:hypothetical protein PIB30_044695 [Stylosanthes scabra]|uniref:Uncharacterized protein n=1 Tax=Stylosanthes scabra TaxID=79078 RepID=A0ABU6SGQ4_9FABA|nr:hypothetical protein [Stylosanthes scabra]